MKTPHLIGGILTILLGGFFVVYGGMDDSPGAQFLGLILAMGGIITFVKGKKN